MIPKLFGWPSSCRAVNGSAAQCSTVSYVMYHRCDAGIGGGGRGPGSVSGAGGFARRLRCGCGRCAPVPSFSGVMV